MKSVRQTWSKRLLTYTPIAALAMLHPVAHAADETLNCKLYMPTTLDAATVSDVAVESAGEGLSMIRRSAVCLFDDGSVADKQMVVIVRAAADGSFATARGYSIYTLETGDSVSTEFDGAWTAEGFQGSYNILDGTGRFAGATGDGTITGQPSSWKSIERVDITLNISTP